MDKTNPTEDRYLVPGLMRGFQVLDVFTPERTELSLSEIAALLDLSRSAAFRTVYTLAHMGFLLHDTRRQSYSLGPAVMRLGHGYMASRELVQIALPEIERLRDETDWSTHMGIRDRRNVLYSCACRAAWAWAASSMLAAAFPPLPPPWAACC